MDKNRLKKVVEKFINRGNSKYTIREFIMLPTYKLDENGQWVPDTHEIFMTLYRHENSYSEISKERDLESKLEQYLGFGFSIYFH